MSDKLLIETLTEQVEVEKTAEEAELEKVANVMNVVEQSQTLTSVGEEMYKIASELGNESLAALAVDTYTLGERMGSCLSKTASEDGSAIEEALEIASDMNKVASAYAEIADDANNEDFNKLAEAVIAISNEMTDEANEVLEAMEKEANVVTDKAKAVKDYVVGKMAPAVTKTKEAFTGKDIKDYLKKTSKKAIGASGHDDTLTSKIKFLLTHKKGLKAAAPAAVAYGGAAAALAGAGYGIKKATDKK